MEDNYAMISTLITSNILLLKKKKFPSIFPAAFQKAEHSEEIIQKEKPVR